MTRIAFRFAAALALLSTGSLQAAQPAASASCMNRDEVRGLVGYMLPSVVSIVVVRCKPGLPAGSYLSARGPQLADSLEQGRAAAWPMAKQAFGKIAGADPQAAKMLDAMPESMLRPVLEDKMADTLTSSIKAKDCKDIDRVVATLAPLPSANLVDFVTEVMVLAGRGKKDLNICAS